MESENQITQPKEEEKTIPTPEEGSDKNKWTFVYDFICRESEQEEEKQMEVEKENENEKEEEKEEEVKEEDKDVKGVETRDEVVAIDNQSEVKQNTDPDVVELSDGMIAEMMRKMLSKGGLTDDVEEEEEKEKKPNKNSRQFKKRLEEQKAAYRKEKEAREKKEKELFESSKSKPAPSIIKTRPLSNAGSKLTALALKQKSAEKAKQKPKANPEANPQAKKEPPKVDIHKIFNRSGTFRVCVLPNVQIARSTRSWPTFSTTPQPIPVHPLVPAPSRFLPSLPSL